VLEHTKGMESKDVDGKETRASVQEKNAFTAPAISLPKGGGAIRGMGEKFAANLVTGTGSMTVPIAVSPGRDGFGPQLSLSYDSGAGNGPFGLGWNLSLPAVTRKTDKGLPQYDDAEESDVFILSGSEDLVPAHKTDANGNLQFTQGKPVIDDEPRAVAEAIFRVRRYRPRIEGLFARIERWTNTTNGNTHWRSITKDNVTTLYGKTENARIFDPADESRVFSWLICESYDDKGNAILYEYKSEDSVNIDLSQINEKNRTDETRRANRYLKRIKYCNQTPRASNEDLTTRTDWLMEVVFDYGEHGQDKPKPDDTGTWLSRPDPFSSYRSGFESRVYRLCRRALMFHHFEQEEGVGKNCLTRSTDFTYTANHIASFISSVSQSGYKREGSGYLKRSLPPLEFKYSEAKVQDKVEVLDAASLDNLPYGLDGSNYQWVDLDGEGISGILTEQAGKWFYKRNLSPINQSGQSEENPQYTLAKFAPAELVAIKPNAAVQGGQAQFMDLAGDGQPDLVVLDGPAPGFYEHDDGSGWNAFRPFISRLNLDTRDPNLKFIDLDGDGHAEVLITEHNAFTWHQSLAEEGFGPARRVSKTHDEEKGPSLVFAGGEQSIYLADLSGDGLTDLVRIRNGEICYWPNLGYGRFGAKVTMDNPPWFDRPDQFDQRRIRLADIDGSGVTDIIYLHGDGVRLYFNQSGNGWSEAKKLAIFPRIGNLSSITVTDLLGNGTACLVWSSPLPGETRRPMCYVDLMGGRKPHLMISSKNNLGAETRTQYAPSTKFYLKDKYDGRPWITRLPFPVHVIERVETFDHVSRNRFITVYKYHHGYFDGVEREFRGFGMVEQWDTGEFNESDQPAANEDASWRVPPVHTKTWFHTGAYLRDQEISRHLGHEYFGAPQDKAAFENWAKENLLDDTVFPNVNLRADEQREAARSLKGAMLRQEVYADDTPAGASEEVFKRSRTPYTVTEQNFTIEMLQPQADNRYAVFFTHPREVINYHFERNIADPRVTHAMTLEVDKYGNALKSLAVGYGRNQSPLPEQRDRSKQTNTLITYTENGVTNPILEPDNYRAPLPTEARTYELTGFKPQNNALRFSFNEFTKDGFALPASAAEIPYEEVADTSQKQKRLIEHVRTLYRKNDLSGLLPLGAVESRALPGESYKLSLTPGLLAAVFKRIHEVQPDEALLPSDLAFLLTGKGTDQGGYVAMDGNWWIPSGRVYFDSAAITAAQELVTAKQHFFLTKKFVDPFNNQTTVEYDAYDLVPVKSRDALGNVITAQLDYRKLQPKLVTDPNGNRTEAEFDALGMVVATAVKGKKTENLGDLLKDFDADPPLTELQSFIADPRGQAASLLGKATTRIVYDLDRFHRCGQPPFAATLARETHYNDPGGTQTKIQSSFSYSDGFGREIQKKVQAESGAAPRRAADIQQPSGDIRPGALIRDVNGKPVLADTSHRCVGTGRTVFNNKGKPVKQYEPFFSSTHLYEEDREMTDAGVSSVIFYDPVERVIATLHPNNTYEKVTFDPWLQATWDVNDTATLDPRTDPDIAGYVAPYFAIQPADWKTWHQQRINDVTRPNEQQAARQTEAHSNTPTVAHLDTLGRTFLTIADNGVDQNGAPQKYATRVVLDIEGNQREVIDAKNRIVMRYDYDMLSARIHQASMEAGERWMLNDATGKPIRAWDSRRFIRRMTYDELRRPTGLFTTENGAERLAERTVYGESQGEAGNLRTRVYRVFDGAGVVTSEAYDFKGNLLRGKRELLPNYKQFVDWLQNPVPNDGSFTSSTAYDALNRAITVTTPDGSVYRPTFNDANLLDKVEVNLRGAAPATPFVTNINYNAKGQRELISYGNSAETTYQYDPLTFRLTNLKTTRTVNQGGTLGNLFSGIASLFGLTDSNELTSQLFNSSDTVQDLRYTYDPAGNITRIEDAAIKTIFYNNEQVEPVNSYTYDAIYRLIEAKGREHIGQTAFDFNPPNGNRRDFPFFGIRANPNDAQAMRNYTERYEYDEVGNFKIVRHLTGGGNWNRDYFYEEPSLLEPGKQSNRLTRTEVGSFIENYSYKDAQGNDVHGCMTAINLMAMVWDFEDQLQCVDLGGGGAAYYVYDASGQRTRKVIETQSGTRKSERIYLGCFEVYREYNGNGSTVTLEHETLHVMDDKKRIALVETRTQGNDIAQRYQLGNHLGSASLELDEDGALIAYEEYYSYGATAFQAGGSAAEVSLKRYRHTGKERDEETGFSYHGARYYAAWLGTWMNSDPAGLVDGPNLYRYVMNNPVRLHDPSGLQHDDDITFTATGPIRRVEMAPHVDEVDAVKGNLAGGVAGSPSDPANKEFKDPRTNTQTKSNFVSNAPANPRPNVSAAVSPQEAGNRLLTGRFSEVDEMNALADDATARTKPGQRTNTALRANMKSDPAIRGALSSVGINPDTLKAENPPGVQQFPKTGTVNLSPRDADLDPATGRVVPGPNTSAAQMRRTQGQVSGASAPKPNVGEPKPSVGAPKPSVGNTLGNVGIAVVPGAAEGVIASEALGYTAIQIGLPRLGAAALAGAKAPGPAVIGGIVGAPAGYLAEGAARQAGLGEKASIGVGATGAVATGAVVAAVAVLAVATAPVSLPVLAGAAIAGGLAAGFGYLMSRATP
jgi:RHS repeat-associated protein